MRVHGPRLMRAGQVDTLRGLLDRLGEVARIEPTCAFLAGWCELFAGRYAEAVAWLDTVVDLLPAGSTPPTSLRINLSLGRGDVATALADASPSTWLACSRRTPATCPRRPGWRTRGRAGCRRPAGCCAERHAGQWLESSLPLRRSRSPTWLWSSWRTGPRRTQRPACGRPSATAAELGLAEYRGVAVAYAVAAAVADEPGVALAHARHAVHLVEGGATRLALAYVLTLAADTLLDRGEPEGRQLLAQARAVVDGCRDPGLAGRRLARTESRHGLAGVLAQRESSAVERLTERELAVLRYLPTQLTQRDIAHELYVSLNTVKTHLQATYRKLGVADRKAAVQAARDLHLL